MAEHRRDRVAHLLQAELAGLLLREVRDPRLRGVTVTAVRMTADLRLARVYYRTLPVSGSVSGTDAASGREVGRALAKAAPFLRSTAGKALGLRVTPELRFEYDSLPETAERVESLLASTETTPPEPEDEE
jgi:ribosome-binding factor A